MEKQKRLKLISIAILSLTVIYSSVASATKRALPLPFDKLTPTDFDAARIRGTGCVWMAGVKGPVLFAAVDERAVVKRAGKYIELTPATGAKELFPFTFDRWKAGRMIIRLSNFGKVRQTGSEVSERAATLSVSNSGTRSWLGVLQCGS